MGEEYELIDSDKLGSQMDFNKVLYLQLNRIMQSMSNNDPNYSYAIEALEALLSWTEDKKFQEEMEELVDAIKTSKEKFAAQRGISVNKLDDSDEDIITFLAIKEKLKSLMKLALRGNFLPERAVIDVIGD